VIDRQGNLFFGSNDDHIYSIDAAGQLRWKYQTLGNVVAPPVIAPGGSEAGAVYRIDLRARELSYTVCDHLPGALAEVGCEVELVPCGGSESIIDQQREQWTDGANVFALAPGVIAIYRRNRCTTEELARRGFRVLAEEDVIAGRAELLGHGPTVVTLLDNELSRARGGPRCMTMPLERDDLD